MNRRRFLRGSAGVLLALPLLESMRPRSVRADGHSAPQRALWWFTPNGQNMDDWAIAETGTGFALSPILQPFAPYRDQMTVVSGLRNYGCDEGTEGHSGCGTYLTCAAGRESPAYNATSIDQLIAAQIGGETLFPSLQLGPNPTSGLMTSAISWAGPEIPLPKVTSAAGLFSRLFGSGLTLSPEETERRRMLRLSILDGVLDDLNGLHPRLPTRDRLKLDQYTTSIRELELRIDKMADSVCDPGDAPGEGETLVEGLDLFCEVMVLAYECDLTRIMTFMLNNEATNQQHPHLGISETYHGLSHHNGDEEMLAKLTTIQTWQTQFFADSFLSRLAAIEDIDGKTLLDNTVILYGSGMGDSSFHDNFDLPLVLFGGTDTFAHGQHVRVTDGPLADLHLLMAAALGADIPELGVASTGPMTGLT